MLPLVALLLFPSPNPVLRGGQETRTINLYRGGPGNYQAVSDTYIDSTTPDENHGGETALSSGPGKTILIRFGDLGSVVPANKRIASAELVLGSPDGTSAEIASIYRLKSGWGEGPYLTLSGVLGRPAKPDSKSTKTPTKPILAPTGSATWKQRLAGENGHAWREAGTGPGDGLRIEGVRLEPRPDAVALTNLGPTVQAMVDRPEANFGFAIRFNQAVDFPSSQSPVRRPRLVITLEDATEASGPDLSVVRIERLNAAGTPPKEGEEAIYTAHIKNVGNAPSPGFATTWTVNERQGATAETLREIKPGEEVTVTTSRPYRPDKTDHRFQNIGIEIEPKGKDVNPRNNGLIVQEGAKQISVTIAKAVAEEVAKQGNARGSNAVEDWVQSQVNRLNEVYFERSRFSFAPDGVRERIALQSVTVAEGGKMGPGVAALTDKSVDLDADLLRNLVWAIGLPVLRGMQIPKLSNAIVPRSSFDRFEGLTGYGDTRFEGSLSGLSAMPYSPFTNAILEANPLEPSGLLCATDVEILNRQLASPASGTEGIFPPLPRALLVKVTDLSGSAIPSAELSFYQSSGSAIKDGPPTFTITTGSSGTAFLVNRDSVGPFGKLDADGGNHTFLIKATANGVTEWGWLKAWQAIDTASRGSKSAAIMELRLDLPGAALEVGTNLAKERIVSDSRQSLPSDLSALVDGDLATSIKLPNKVGEWVEIDLGRDRTIAEVGLHFAASSFWSRYEIKAYATGQGPDDNSPWAYETDLPWTLALRTEGPDAKGQSHLTYRGQPRRFRYLRLINRSGEAGSLAEVTLTAAKVAPQN